MIGLMPAGSYHTRKGMLNGDGSVAQQDRWFRRYLRRHILGGPVEPRTTSSTSYL